MAAAGGGSSSTAGGAESGCPPIDRRASRRHSKFEVCLSPASVDKKILADLAWQGVPATLSRAEIWQLLLGYRPLTRERRSEALQRKRLEYRGLRRDLYDESPAVVYASDCDEITGTGERDSERALLRQIRKDLPRTRIRAGAAAAARSAEASAGSGSSAGAERAASKEGPETIVEHRYFQALMERVLFVWAVRQPASGYVQGHNDVLLPLIFVFLSDMSGKSLCDLNGQVLEELGEEKLADVEADTYWCVAKILSEIFDHYTHGQPGIQRMATQITELIKRVDVPLADHLREQNIELFAPAFRWITCLMVREMPIACVVRLWDALIAESAQAAGQSRGSARPSRDGKGQEGGSAGFEVLLCYFCVCFMTYFSQQLQAMDFEQITFFLQRLPTDNFNEDGVEVLLGEAFVLKSLFQMAPGHLQS